MLLRKYRGKNLKDAIRQVKADLGESATIVSTKTVSAGLFGSQLEVTATLAPSVKAEPKPVEPVQQLAAPSLEVHQVARFLSPIRNEIRSLNRQVRALANEQKQGGKVEDALDELMEMLKAIQLNPECAVSMQQAVEPEVLQKLRQKLHHSGMRDSHAELVLERVQDQLPEDPSRLSSV